MTTRYAFSALDCENSTKPGYLCNGVLFRAVNDSVKPPIWDVTDKDIARGAVTFAWMHDGVKFKSLINGYSHGFIFKPYLQAPGRLHPLVRCVFPLAASTNSRDEQGCGASPGYPKSGPCQLNGVSTGEQWLAHFKNEGGGTNAGQCGFSMPSETSTDYLSFRMSISARKLVGEQALSQPNELLLSVWPKGKGKELPLEAFFYVADSATGREAAMRDQQDLNTRDGVLIPVIMITLPQTLNDKATFTYNADDQTSPMPLVEDLGDITAASLTARYADTSANCGSNSTPAFLCTGVMLRGTSNNPTYHVWDNSPASIAKGGVSFSYLRTDAPIFRLAYTYNNGYFFNAYFHVSEKLLPEVLCFFPTDGDSYDRADKGCGAKIDRPGSDSCHLSGITTAQQWWEHYTAHTENRDEWQCSFSVEDDRNSLAGPAFFEGIKAMALVGREPADKPNEMILAAWKDGLGKVLPLEAFFYLSGSSEGRTVARRNQTDLYATDGVLLPVIEIQLPKVASEPAGFFYHTEDQGYYMPVPFTVTQARP
ncbi:hypothetical protein ACIPL1_09610 [Pseudomonas sp. NPDC090202]|uniref:hypothetical protein n=1 Tax=Pseudomonas sp. NPDC090202 TaxID=3364476 RepID=UPI003829B84E